MITLKKQTKKVIVIFLIISSLLMLEACGLLYNLDGKARDRELAQLQKSNSVLTGGTNPVTGEVTGVEDYIYKKLWSNNGQDLICTDSAALFQFTLIRDPKADLPEDSHLKKGDIPSSGYYFRLDAHGMERLADKDKCLIREDSLDRVWTVIEGYYAPKNASFTVLSCSIYGAPDSASLSVDENGKYLSGQISCAEGSKVFTFSNMELK